MRFSLQAMLTAFAFVAVSCAGILYANRVWATCFFTAAFIAILFGVVSAWLSRGPNRAFWIGFAIFAGGYFSYAMFGEQLHPIQDTGQGNYWKEPTLATSALLLWLDNWLTRTERGSSFAMQGLYSDGSYRTVYSGGPATHVLLTGHSIFAIIIGLVGGLVGRRVYDRQALQVTRDT